MKVVITESASVSLWHIYLHHLDYTRDYAEAFQFEIDRFIIEHLSANPLIGHIYHEERGIRRLIFQKRYNIYYTVRGETVFVLFIFDGRMDINRQFQEEGVDVEALLGWTE
jgi:plasmid stabilization system protein ParE